MLDNKYMECLVFLSNITCVFSHIKKSNSLKHDKDGFTEQLTLHIDTQYSEIGEQSALEAVRVEVR